MPSLAFDLGGTYLRCAVAGDGGDLSARESLRIPNFLTAAPDATLWESILGSIDRYAERTAVLVGPADPIVIAFPGPVVDGTIIAAPTIAGNAPPLGDLAERVAARTKRRTFVLNDLSAAALYMSASVQSDRFMIVTVSSGIGSKVFDRRHAAGVIDDVAYAGEIGHCTVDRSPVAPRCDCGGRGHLGAVSSGRGTERLARRLALEDAAAFALSACVTALGATAETLNNEDHLVPAIRSGDRWAIGVMNAAMLPLADVLAAAAFALGLDEIIVVGGFALSIGATYEQALNDLVAAPNAGTAFALPRRFVSLGAAHPDACLLGAAAYARRLAADAT